jgi:type II secretory pathway component PulM
MDNIATLRQRAAYKATYGVRCSRDLNRLAELEDAARAPLVRLARKVMLGAVMVILLVVSYAPIVIPAVNYFVGV